MADVVYVVKENRDNVELRYSLRSLSNVPHDTVWIVGYKPSWARNVEHLPTRPQGTKYQNSTANLLTAATHDDVSESFIYMNDDFFIMEKLDAIPVLHRGPVKDVEDHYDEKYGAGDWLRGMQETRAMLEDWGYAEPLSYELHIPMVMEKGRLREAVRRVADDGRRITALHKRTLYGNLYDIGGERVDDVKIAMSTGPTSGSPTAFLSTSDGAFRAMAGRRIRQAFPNPSPYEN